MELVPVALACPVCGSADVFYSCKPECCFNHVCNSCYTTFELETEGVGETGEELFLPPELDSTHPTAPCARCGEAPIYARKDAADGSPIYVCAACKALLTLSFAHVRKG